MTESETPRLIRWKPQTEDGRRLQDVAEILHDLGLSLSTIRHAVFGYLKNRFPEVNCTIQRGDLENYLFSLTTGPASAPAADETDDGDGLAGF